MVALYVDNQVVGTKKMAAPKRADIKSWFKKCVKAFPKELECRGLQPTLGNSLVQENSIRMGSFCGRIGFVVDRLASSL